jgi:hypothetical protein
MDKKIIPFLAVLILFASPVFASEILVDAFNDTYTISNDSTVYGFLPTINLTKGESLFKFDITNATSHLFSVIKFRIYPSLGFCNIVGGCYFEIHYFNNNSWDENITGLTRPSGTRTIISAVALGTTAGDKGSLDFFGIDTPWLGGATRSDINKSTAITGIYSNDTLTLFIGSTFFSPGSGSPANLNASIYSINSIFVNNYPRLNITVVDYLNGTKSNTDLTTYTMLDFETRVTLTGQTIDAMDLFYLPAINSIYPNAGNGVSLAYATTSTTPDNDLQTRIRDCYSISSYNTDAHNPNINPGVYSYICVNLSSRHQGKPFYGMLKIINNTNVRGNATNEFDYYYAVASPNYIVWSTPTLSPDPAQIGSNLTIGTTTTITLVNAVMFFRYNASGNFTPWGTVNSEYFNSYNDVHSFILNNQYVTSASYQIYFIANDGVINYTSQVFSFTVSQPFYNQTNQSALPGALSGLVASGVVPDISSALWFFSSLIVVMGTGLAFWFGGLKFGLLSCVSLIVSLALMGFLPGFIVIPIFIVVGIVITRWVIGVFGST